MLVLLILAVLFPSPSQARHAAAGPPRDYQDPEAYIVYSTILPSDWIIRDSHAKHLVILRETRVYQMCLRPEPEFERPVCSRVPPLFEHLRKRFDGVANIGIVNMPMGHAPDNLFAPRARQYTEFS